MTDIAEHSARDEDAILQVFDNQFPTFTKKVIDNLERLSDAGETWPTKFLLWTGALLLLASLLLKVILVVNYPFYEIGLRLSPVEFSTLIASASGLIAIGALFRMYQTWSWRKIVLAQQVVGTEILNKQIDIAKDMVATRRRLQGGQLILLPIKIRKRHRC